MYNKIRMAGILLMAQMLSQSEFGKNEFNRSIDKDKLLKEYELIKKKESNLSANERRKIVNYVESNCLNMH